MCLHLHVYYLFAVCSLLCVSSPYFPKMKKVGVGVLQYSNILCVKFNHLIAVSWSQCRGQAWLTGTTTATTQRTCWPRLREHTRRTAASCPAVCVRAGCADLAARQHHPS